MKISRSYRLLRLYTWLEGVKCVSMAQAESEFHVGTRTIQRDIADIRVQKCFEFFHFKTLSLP